VIQPVKQRGDAVLRIAVYTQSWWLRLPRPAWRWERVPASRRLAAKEDGQSTAEYALVMLAAAAIALVLLAWARSSGKLPAFFDSIIDRIVGSAD
jgi:Flp pilus assembly pilin Flp